MSFKNEIEMFSSRQTILIQNNYIKIVTTDIVRFCF